MKNNKIIIPMMIACLLAGMALMTACDDERTPPSTAPDTTYSETIMLFEGETAAGQNLSATFEVLDDVKEGFIKLTCYFYPDTAMDNFERYGKEIDSIEAVIEEELNVGIGKLGLEIRGFPSRLREIVADSNAIVVEIVRLEAVDPRSEAEQDTLDNLLSQQDSLKVLLDSLRIRKEVIPVEREVYRVQKAVNEALVNERMAYRDILDIILDNRFKVSVTLDDDTVVYYPEAVFVTDAVEIITNYFDLDTTFFDPVDGSVKDGVVLDTTTIDPTHLNSVCFDSLKGMLRQLLPDLETLHDGIDVSRNNWDTLVEKLPDDSVMVWGQGIFQAPYPEDSTNARGITFQLDLDEFWVADSGWAIGEPFIHPVRPERGSVYTNQYPVRSYMGRLTPGSTHTLHFRFGAAGTDTKITASLYVVYFHKVVR